MTIRSLLPAVLSVLLFASCGTQNSENQRDLENKMQEARRQDVAELNRKAAIIQTQVDNLPSKEYHAGSSTRPVTVLGYFMKGELVHVDETVSLGREGNERNRYYYSNGSLFLYNQQKTLYTEGAPGEKMIERSTTTVAYDMGENPLAAKRTVSGVTDKMPDEEATAVLKRGRELFRHFADGTPPSEPVTASEETQAPEGDEQAPADAGGDAVAATPGTIPSGVFTERVRFRKGTSSTTITGRVTGFEVRDYMLRALKGQTMGVSLQSKDAVFAVHFNGKNISGESKNWSGKLPRYGDYHVRVFLPGEKGRQGVSTDYAVTISVK
jgi:hypothetical protein